DGRRTATPSTNVVVNNVSFGLGYGSDGAMLAVGPQMAGNIYNTYAYNLSTWANMGRVLSMKSNPSMGGLANNINIDTVSTSALNQDVAYITFNDDSDASWAGPTGFN